MGSLLRLEPKFDSKDLTFCCHQVPLTSLLSARLLPLVLLTSAGSLSPSVVFLPRLPASEFRMESEFWCWDPGILHFSQAAQLILLHQRRSRATDPDGLLQQPPLPRPPCLLPPLRSAPNLSCCYPPSPAYHSPSALSLAVQGWCQLTVVDSSFQSTLNNDSLK